MESASENRPGADGGSAGTPPRGLRERKKAQVQAQLVTTAWELFAEHGFAAVTVDQIVEAAGVSRSSFFRYFDTKDAALFHNTRLALDNMEADFEFRSRSTPPRQALHQSLLQAATDYEPRRSEYRTLRRLMREDRVLRASAAAYNQSLLAEMTSTYLRQLGQGDELAARVEVAVMWAAATVALESWVRADGEDLLPLTVRALAALHQDA
ncbi:TetR/AcrR family transcriptional regulator [Arthrobacter sunyaminii]|uniref:TetR/AcrR family transcriptional regulator n=1 Tax=Arthrobacter sunyaminii TaxID=2816859 RepID=UPI001A953BC8|nr:TetR/AcrR family transcriptional regulator [Arthrobacter sunyaminii]MBO0895213.1 TetR family transcriptional regulator [Arthrobacter sunyaminii]